MHHARLFAGLCSLMAGLMGEGGLALPGPQAWAQGYQTSQPDNGRQDIDAVVRGLNQEAEKLLDARQFAEAQARLEKALSTAQGREGKLQIETWNMLGAVHREAGRYDQALAAYDNALRLAGRPGLATASERRNLLSNRALTLHRAGRTEEAIRLNQSVIAEMRAAPEADALALATSFNNLARNFEALRRYPEAAASFQEALNIRAEHWGSRDRRLLPILDGYVRALMMIRRFEEAVPALKWHLALFRQEHGADHPQRVNILDALVSAALNAGDPAEAVAQIDELIRIHERAGRERSARVGVLLSWKANALLDLGRHPEVQAVVRSARAILAHQRPHNHEDIISLAASEAAALAKTDSAEVALAAFDHALALALSAPGHPRDLVLAIHVNRVDLLWSSGRLPEAHRAHQEIRRLIADILSGPPSSDAAGRVRIVLLLIRLGTIEDAEGDFAAARQRYRQALDVAQRPSDLASTRLWLMAMQGLAKAELELGNTLASRDNALKVVEAASGRQAAFRPQLKAALAHLAGIAFVGADLEQHRVYLEQLRGLVDAAHPQRVDATILVNHALLLANAGRHGEAGRYADDALSLAAAAQDAQAWRGAVVVQVGRLLQLRGETAAAETRMREGLQLIEQAPVVNRGDHSVALRLLANLQMKREQFGQAWGTLARATTLLEAQGSAGNSRALAVVLAERARAGERLGLRSEARALARRASDLVVRSLDAKERSGNDGAIREERNWARFTHEASLDLVGPGTTDVQKDRAIIDEAFQIAQQIGQADAARALAVTRARHTVGSGPLGQKLRERQDLLRFVSSAEGRLADLASASGRPRDLIAEQRLRQQLEQDRQRLDAVEAELAAGFAEYRSLHVMPPLSLARTQERLAPDEALAFWVPTRSATFAFIIRRDQAVMRRIAVSSELMGSAVRRLRDALDPRGRTLIDMPPLDLQLAHQLYQDLMGFAGTELSGVTRLIVVAEGALQSLPPAILVARPPDHAQATAGSGPRAVEWLIRRHAISVLPSVASLNDLRTAKRPAAAMAAFAGFGDPVFRPSTMSAATGDIGNGGITSFFRGARADAAAIAALAPLPETAEELRRQAAALQAPPASVVLGREATVRRIARTDLSRTRVISFATHALIAGELPELGEPALVFTPPETPDEEDDGLLRASQISRMNLNADWVILSACNTAAPDGSPGAEAFSGLAKAFFHAGARSLLVSHWAVDSQATVALTTGAFRELARNPRAGRARAVQLSVQAMLDRKVPGREADWAHPFFWAPFILVGE